MTTTEELPEADVPVPATIPLLVADRCDHGNCNAQALVRYILGFSGLQFCGHHSIVLEYALTSKGFEIDQDLRKKS